MNANPTWTAIFSVMIVLELVGCGLFIGMYTTTWPWWRNEMGRYTIGFSSSLFLFMLYYVLRIVGVLPSSIGVSVVLFLILLSVTYWQLILFIRIRREQRRAKAAEVGRGEDARD